MISPRYVGYGCAVLAVVLGVGCASSNHRESEEEGGGPPFVVQAAMWIPNRVLDALEMVRLGVGVGPGIGVDLRLTELAQLSAMTGFAAGIGWQGRWHPPVLLDSRTFVAAGPLTIGATRTNPVTSWKRTFFEVRAEVHAALVVAEVAVDFEEIWDFLAGLLFFDPAHDDILGPFWL